MEMNAQTTIHHRSNSNTAKVIKTTGVVTYIGSRYVCVKPARGREVTIYRSEIVSEG